MNRKRSSLFGISIISSYLFAEALINFGICTLIFTLTGTMTQIFRLAELVINKGLSLQDTFTLILYFIPSLIYLILPLSLLMGILITLGRMSSDGETLALKASGLSLGRILRPIMVVALMAYVLTTLFTVHFSPLASFALKRHIYDIARNKAEIGLKERIFNNDFSNLIIYVNDIIPQTHHLKGVFISDSRKFEEPSTIIAQSGYLVSKPEELELTLHLENGSIHRLNRKTDSYQKIDFGSYRLNLDLHATARASDKRRGRDEEEMTTPELLVKARNQQPDGEHYNFLVEFHSRFAIPFACIVFGLLAVPLGVFAPRSGRSYGFVVGLIVIIFYYLAFSFARNLGSTGVVPPAGAIWFPNALFLVLGCYLFRKGEADSNLPILEHLARLVEFLRHRLNFLAEATDQEKRGPGLILEDLNSDSGQILMLKLGVDRGLAENIIAYRQAHGGISDIKELRKVVGIDDIVFKAIKENILS